MSAGLRASSSLATPLRTPRLVLKSSRQAIVYRNGFRRSQEKRNLATMSHAYGPASVCLPPLFSLRSVLDPKTQLTSPQPPLLELTIPQHFQQVVSLHGDHTAVISRAQNERLTYRELDERSNVLAHGLRERGVRKGDRVAVSLGNSWEFASLTYALFKLGAILVPLNPAFNATQVISALAHLEAAHLIIGLETNLPYKPPRENVAMLEALVPNLSSSRVESASVPSLNNIILVDNSEGRINTSTFGAASRFEDLLASSSRKGQNIIPDSELHRDEIVNIQFTSGTTSSPKAACLTHRSILNNGFSIGSRMRLSTADIVCCPPPLFHCFGCILGYMATATHGSAILFPSEAFNPEATLLSIQEEKATALYGVATMFVAELELLANGRVGNLGFEYLRTGIAAGSSVPSNLMEKLHKTLNLTGLTICYGMTETSPVSCMTTLDDPLQKRIDSVGRLLPHVEAKVVSTNDRSEILPRGEKGELVVSGYLVMKGYWGDKERTEEVRTIEKYVDEQGTEREKVWMHTGDEALMDEDGYVKITGRIKDLIIRGGENIHPLEVENVLFKHDHVSEASVVGLPDERYGECVAAFVVVHKNVKVGVDDAGEGDPLIEPFRKAKKEIQDQGTASILTGDIGEGKGESGPSTAQPKTLTRHDVREWVRGNLSNHLVPRYVFWVKDYPKTASGKIQKFKLREMGIEMLKDAAVKAGTKS
ncbi:Acyl-ligase [Hyphodiscus hymeniophilus]|uniref:Acyl-ligase n=1 Tax=Hyphodiscus hymeniophilus TaxID=353542 RepID=A0A9P6VML2_9HELO|nr:Acyl-ligase [Hyphodiscus hymeniophilus]